MPETVHETDAIHRRIAEGNVTPKKRKSSTPTSSPSPKKQKTPSSPLREVQENGEQNGAHDAVDEIAEAVPEKDEKEENSEENTVKIEDVNAVKTEDENAENSGKGRSPSRRKSSSPTKFTFSPKPKQSPEIKLETQDSPDSTRKSNRTPKKTQKLIESEEISGTGIKTIETMRTLTPPVTTPQEATESNGDIKRKYGRPKGSKNKRPRSDKGKGRRNKKSEHLAPDVGIDPRFGGKLHIQSKPKAEKSAPESKGPKIKVAGQFSTPKSIKFLDQEEETKERKLPKVSKEQQRLYRANVMLTDDASRIDKSWKCVFCQKHSHDKNLGDLFGPYFVNLPEKPDEDFLPTTRRRSTSECRTEPEELEVWFHDRCLYWAPNVYMLAGKIIGLEVFIGELENSVCNHCHMEGATISCYHRGCANRSHFPCATGRWQIVDDSYRCYCPNHHV